MAKINIEFDGKIYSVDENKLAPLASPLERALIQQLAGTGAVIRLGSANYNVDANKLASARNVLTNHLGTVSGADSKVTVNGIEYGLSKTKLQSVTDRINETLDSMATIPASEGLEFELNDDGQSYYVKGIGTCTDTDVVIPSSYNGLPVTAIGVETNTMDDFVGFYRCDQITSVIIPDSVTVIGGGVFASCDNLTSVTIPNGVTYIGMGAFHSDKLTTITLPNSVTYIHLEGLGSISVLTFNGTVEQWNRIYLCDDGFGNIDISSVRLLVQCTDGEVEIPFAGALPPE